MKLWRKCNGKSRKSTYRKIRDIDISNISEDQDLYQDDMQSILEMEGMKNISIA